MPAKNRRARFELERQLADALPDQGATRYWDRLGTAMYQVEPNWLTAIVCLSCLFVAIIPTLPKSLAFTYECSRCGQRIPLEPPTEVLVATPRIVH